MTTKRLRILLVETCVEDAQNILAKLPPAGYALEHQIVDNAQAIQAALENSTFDVILCSDDPDGFGGLDALKLLRQPYPDIPFILLAHRLQEATVIRTLQKEADDYILKGNTNRLISSIEHNLHAARIRQEHREMQQSLLENQTRLQAFIADLPGLACQIHLNTNGQVTFLYVSEGCNDLLGLSSQDLIDNANLFEAMLHPQVLNSYQQSMQHSAKHLSFWNWEGRVVLLPSNEIKWINLRCTPRLANDGTQWEGIMLNITQSKLAKVELRQSQEQLRELSAHIHDVREQERISIAREVHDDLGSLLTATRLEIAWLAGRLKDQTVLAQKAQEIEDLVAKCTRAAVNISRNLRPSTLDTFGIIAAIENEANEFSRRTGITCNLDNNDEGAPISPDVAITLFRIFQETLNNITKHAQATQVSISVVNRESCVELVVSDNGRGIRDADRSKLHSFGLRGIFERVAHFGGEVKLESALNKGTTVSISIPHQDANSAVSQFASDNQQALFD